MGKAMKIVMIEDDLAEVARFSAYFATEEDMELVAAADGASQGFEAVVSNGPDVVLLDLELKEGNGIQLLPRIKALENSPYVVVTTWTTDASTLRKVRESGAGYIQAKNMEGYAERGPRMVADFLREMRPYFGNTPKVQTDAVGELMDPLRLKRRQISEDLGRIGVAAGNFSHNYLRESILIVATNESGAVELDNEIYPALKKMFHVSVDSIEIAMRRAISKVWLRTDLETIQREYTQYVDPEKGHPELKEFIGYYGNKYR